MEEQKNRTRGPFGVSLPLDLIEKVNRVCEGRSWSNSRLVQDAVEMFLDHLEAEHGKR